MNVQSRHKQPFGRLTISLVVPVRNGGAMLEKCLESVALARPGADEVIVVSDGCTDNAWKKVSGSDVRIIRREKTGGPAKARNAGADAATGDILFFLDADVILHKNAIAIIRDYFERIPSVDALFGSYDDRPTGKNFLSQYRNLFNHFIHQNASPEATTFWGACGAVRSRTFQDLGGFNETFRVPSIEDIELGSRMKKAGKTIRLLKKLYVTHMKEWRFFPMVKTDIFRRAIPWSRLMLTQKTIGKDLNLKYTHKISCAVLLASLFWAGMGLLFPLPMIPVLMAPALLLALNANLYWFFWQSRGFLFMLRSIPMHWLYYFYSGISFLYCWLEAVCQKRCYPSFGKDS